MAAFVAVDLLLVSLDVGLQVLDELRLAPDVLAENAVHYSISADRSVAERWNFVKWAVAIAAFCTAAWRRDGIFLLLAAVPAALLLDDWGRLHERFGGAVGRHLVGIGDPLVQAVGEVAVFALIGAAVFAMLLGAGLLGGAQVRAATRRLFVLLAVLAAFGVGVDFVHSVWLTREHGRLVHYLCGLVEDGGELVLISAVAAHALAAARIRAPWPGG